MALFVSYCRDTISVQQKKLRNAFVVGVIVVLTKMYFEMNVQQLLSILSF